MATSYVRKPRRTFEKECAFCYKIFTVCTTEADAARRAYCSPECKLRQKNLMRRLRLCGAIPPSAKTRRVVEERRGRYSLEVDPWTTGQLPSSVTRNALWSRP